MESVEWINLILERFWTVFEPALSAQVIEKVNLVLEQQKPIFLDKLMLKEFTLGSNAPCIIGTRAYRKTASNMIVSHKRNMITIIDCCVASGHGCLLLPE